MTLTESFRKAPGTIAIVGDYVPRRCGIATFTADLLRSVAAEAPGSNCFAVVMSDTPEGYRYPEEVRFEVRDRRVADYQLAADFLNVNQVNVVCVQHEFGIYGGPNGSHLLSLVRELRMPTVTTLHTVLSNPKEGQKAVLEELAHLSDRLVVMSNKAAELLREVYGVPEEKITLIYHGIPDLPFVDPNYFKDQFGVEGRRVILTFGLLSPGKGIETMIEALPAIVEKHRDVVYIVLGATHPNIQREQGEAYRLSLHRKARQLGVEEHVVFHNRFVELKELCEFLGAADIYVTPYLNKEQVVSGTLSYALGAGKATISTPYWYAEEMLAEGRGRLVPFRDAEALAREVNDLLDHEVERHAMRKRAYSFCRQMIWKEVARRYLELFAEVEQERRRKPRPLFRSRSLQEVAFEAPEPKFDHLLRLTDDVGILQHAKSIVPDRFHGYCTDDNARALIAVLMAREQLPEVEELADLDTRYLSFILHAFNHEAGCFRNFMTYDRRWLEERGSEDSHGRAVWGLGWAVALERPRELSDVILATFERAIEAMLDFQFPRALAFGLVGIHAYLRRFGGDMQIRNHREVLANRLFELYKKNATDEWPWIEDVVTYDNGKIPQALVMSGQWLGHPEMVEAGLRSLEWLMSIQTDKQGHFVPIGNGGWFRRDGHRARFDQQPLEAQSMVEACVEAYRVTNDPKWAEAARRCFEWFLGRNDLDVALYDYRSGGCRDGLTATGANVNQGAEATLSWLLALLNIYWLESAEKGPAATEPKREEQGEEPVPVLER